MENKCLFNINRRVWSIAFGWGTVIKSDVLGVVVKFDSGKTESYTEDGRVGVNENPTLFLNEFVIPEIAYISPAKPAKELLNECKEEEFKFGKNNYYIYAELYSDDEIGIEMAIASHADRFGIKYISQEDAEYIVANCKENQRGDFKNEFEKF